MFLVLLINYCLYCLLYVHKLTCIFSFALSTNIDNHAVPCTCLHMIAQNTNHRLQITPCIESVMTFMLYHFICQFWPALSIIEGVQHINCNKRGSIIEGVQILQHINCKAVYSHTQWCQQTAFSSSDLNMTPVSSFLPSKLHVLICLAFAVCPFCSLGKRSLLQHPDTATTHLVSGIDSFKSGIVVNMSIVHTDISWQFNPRKHNSSQRLCDLSIPSQCINLQWWAGKSRESLCHYS